MKWPSASHTETSLYLKIDAMHYFGRICPLSSNKCVWSLHFNVTGVKRFIPGSCLNLCLFIKATAR